MAERVRDGGAADAASIAHVHRLSRAAYYGTQLAVDPGDGREAMWASLLVQPGRRTLLAELDGEAVGFVSMARPDAEPGSLELTSLYVLPDHSGAGVGTRLHDEYEQERRPGERGVLEVWAANDRAGGFYRRRGWVPTDRRRDGPGEQPYVTWVLPASRSS